MHRVTCRNRVGGNDRADGRRAMTGIEVAVGLLIAWAVRKANRAGRRLDEIADEAIDTGLDQVRDVVVAKLGGDPALARLEAEASATGQVAERTQARVRLALEDAATDDAEFAERLEQAVQQAQPSGAGTAANNRGVAVNGDVSGIVSTGDHATITQRR
jgi:hypothetical protein